jgi:hypothetical protein
MEYTSSWVGFELTALGVIGYKISNWDGALGGPGFLGMKDYAIFVIEALEMNSIMFFVYFAFWGLQEELSTLPCTPCFTS